MTNIISNQSFLQLVIDVIVQARTKTYRAVNTIMIETYRQIGKMIVEQEQDWSQRAEYGTHLIGELSTKLTDEFGRGFGERNLRLMRQFFTSFPILHSVSSQLTRTHYKVLMRIEKPEIRARYTQEAIDRQLSVRQLERQIHTSTYERILAHDWEIGIEEKDILDPTVPNDILKDPYILEFTGISSNNSYLETDLEKALISNIESFLLELGKWFTFYARQKHIQTETSDFFIDLVFYNYHLKCFLIIDLKTDKLKHQDIWQMDMYVRMFDDMIKPVDDNPTIWLILCSDKDETIVKYSVLSDNEQLFASKYLLYLPSEEELQSEINKQREFISIDQ